MGRVLWIVRSAHRIPSYLLQCVGETKRYVPGLEHGRPLLHCAQHEELLSRGAALPLGLGGAVDGVRHWV